MPPWTCMESSGNIPCRVDALHNWREVTQFVSCHKKLILFLLLQFCLELFNPCRVQFTRFCVNWTLLSGSGRVGGEANLARLLRGMNLRNSHLQNSSSSFSIHMSIEPFCTLYSGLWSHPGNTFPLLVFLSLLSHSQAVQCFPLGPWVLPLINSCIAITCIQDLPHAVGYLASDLIFSW